MKEIKDIREKLSAAELLAQLAEECMELGHAALKLRRVMSGENPTPTPPGEACEKVSEEIADVILVLKVLGYDYDSPFYHESMSSKAKRWISRLNDKEKTDGD